MPYVCKIAKHMFKELTAFAARFSRALGHFMLTRHYRDENQNAILP